MGLFESGRLPALRGKSVRSDTRFLPVGRLARRHSRRNLCLRIGQGRAGYVLDLAGTATNGGDGATVTYDRSRAAVPPRARMFRTGGCAARGPDSGPPEKVICRAGT